MVRNPVRSCTTLSYILPALTCFNAWRSTTRQIRFVYPGYGWRFLQFNSRGKCKLLQGPTPTEVFEACTSIDDTDGCKYSPVAYFQLSCHAANDFCVWWARSEELSDFECAGVSPGPDMAAGSIQLRIDRMALVQFTAPFLTVPQQVVSQTSRLPSNVLG